VQTAICFYYYKKFFMSLDRTPFFTLAFNEKSLQTAPTRRQTQPPLIGFLFCQRLVLCIICILLLGCSTADRRTSAAQGLQSPLVTETRPTIRALPALMVVNKNDRLFGASLSPQESIDLFVDDMYHASLPPGLNVSVELCVGPNRLDFFGRDASGRAYLLGREIISAQENTWTLLQVNSSIVQFRALKESLTPTQFQQLARPQDRLHTVSRVTKNCAPAPAITASAVVPPATAQPLTTLPTLVSPSTAVERKPDVTLNYQFNYLRNHDRLHEASDIAKLGELIAHVQRDASRIEKLTVVGHTDNMGPVALNMELSTRRALNIANDIAAATGLGVGVQHRGVGPLFMTATNCGSLGLNRPQMIECNRPNRRVEVQIFLK
jgi:outer membrane protein OmpA-like peptidoglycan-associated protein